MATIHLPKVSPPEIASKVGKKRVFGKYQFSGRKGEEHIAFPVKFQLIRFL